MSDVNARVERQVSDKLLVTEVDLRSAITADKKGAMFNYGQEVPVFLKTTAQRAEKFGQALCASADCELDCVGIDLQTVATPQTHIDGVLKARCVNATCDAVAVVQATHVFFQESLGQL